MESSIFTTTYLLDKFLSFISDFAYILNGVLLISVSAVLLFSLFIVYKKIRKKFPVTVNCWFCNYDTKVPYNYSNCWDCPHCHQYNGFNKDGSYNKVIEEQYNPKLNEDIFNTLKTNFKDKESSRNSQSNGFCKLCNINQQLKIQQLALFVPINEKNYFEEIQEFREKLEKAYRLCTKCENVLKETLEKQEYNLLQTRLNSQKTKIGLETLENVAKYRLRDNLAGIKKLGVTASRWICFLLSISLLLSLSLQFETIYEFINSKLVDNEFLEPLESILMVSVDHVRSVYNFKREISFTGFLLSLLPYFQRQGKPDLINLIIWGFLHILFWSEFKAFQSLVSAASIFFSHQVIRNKQIYLSRKSISKKFGFQPEKQTFPETFTFPRNEAVEADFGLSSPVMDSSGDSFEISKCDESQTKLPMPPANLFGGKGTRKRTKKKENEIESLPNETDNGVRSKSTPETPPNAKGGVLNSSVFNKTFLSILEQEKNDGIGHFDEVHSNLSELSLGGKQKKTKKPSNFLFANHNFSERKSTSSIIKPAKFIRNLSNSWTCAESNESASRSSTPSSMYSSQRMEKPESRYDFSKTTPLSLNPYSRPFDYYDGNGFYNNFNCFSPGFVPLQQFPGPMGHTTVYTYTRPTNFPFPFPGFPNYNKSSPSSPRFSDVSDCDNLFQNTSKSFEKGKKWLKLRTFFYYFSIFLNFVTFFSLVYFLSAGIILVDWKLPNLNFIV